MVKAVQQHQHGLPRAALYRRLWGSTPQVHSLGVAAIISLLHTDYSVVDSC